MSSLSQRMHEHRTQLGVVTLLCLLWHIFLPSMVNFGVMPALYSMSSHCLPALKQSAPPLTAQHTTPHHDMGSMQMSGMSMGSQQMNSMHHHDMSNMSDKPSTQQLINKPTTSPLQTTYAHQVIELAAKIMKHCPLCSHGLEAGLLLSFIAFVLLLIIRWFAIVRCLQRTLLEPRNFPQPSFILPFKHAPPIAL